MTTMKLKIATLLLLAWLVGPASLAEVLVVKLADASTTTAPEPASRNLPGLEAENKAVWDDVLERLEVFRRSRYFVPLFDEQTRSIPAVQHEFQVKTTAKELDLFREILREAIDKRNRFAPSATLVLKYSGRILSDLIRGRREEMALKPRAEPDPSFFKMVGSLIGEALDKSNELKRLYNKQGIDTEQLHARVDAIFDQVLKTIESSPVGGYLKWNEMKLITETGDRKPFVEETADLMAQFRQLGYEGGVFVAKRIVNLLNMFSLGMLPSASQV